MSQALPSETIEYERHVNGLRKSNSVSRGEFMKRKQDSTTVAIRENRSAFSAGTGAKERCNGDNLVVETLFRILFQIASIRRRS